jgi:hypothetical protein
MTNTATTTRAFMRWPASARPAVRPS